MYLAVQQQSCSPQQSSAHYCSLCSSNQRTVIKTINQTMYLLPVMVRTLSQTNLHHVFQVIAHIQVAIISYFSNGTLTTGGESQSDYFPFQRSLNSKNIPWIFAIADLRRLWLVTANNGSFLIQHTGRRSTIICIYPVMLLVMISDGCCDWKVMFWQSN